MYERDINLANIRGSVREGFVDFVGLTRVDLADLSDDLTDEIVLLVFQEHNGHVELERLREDGQEVVRPCSVFGTAQLVSKALKDVAECLRLQLRLTKVAAHGGNRDSLKVGQLLSQILFERLKISIETRRCLWHL